MENLNFDNDAIIDPKDEAIENLRQQLAEANRRDDLKADQLDQLGDAIMALIGDNWRPLSKAALVTLSKTL
jgi:predicted RNase H-like nuclease